LSISSSAFSFTLVFSGGGDSGGGGGGGGKPLRGDELL
jgi:hypothetical protein